MSSIAKRKTLMKPRTVFNRDTLITVLLVVAGIVLALVLFGAGVLWRSNALPKSSSALTPLHVEHPRAASSERGFLRLPSRDDMGL
jgi:hypothetical protein